MKANCDCNIKTNDKKTPLHFAAIYGYFDISKILIENGAIINVYDNEKNTPLHYICIHAHVEKCMKQKCLSLFLPIELM